MRVGVIRGDLPGPIFLSDLEPTSQTNFPVEPGGQTRYISRPSLTGVEVALATAPAALASTSNITFPLTIDGTNDTLLIRTAGSGAYTTVTLAHAAYANRTTLLVAVNAALVASGLAVYAGTSIGLSQTLRLCLMTRGALLGFGTVLDIDSVANGSTANTALGLGAATRSFVVPRASAAITALLPVGGPLDVSQATILSTVSMGLTADQVAVVANSIAPRFVETDVAIKSFEKGVLAGFLSSSFVPDSHRLPAMTPGAAITVVQDDGVSAFTAPVPAISGAVHDTPNAGDLTITGVGLANAEQDNTTISITNPATLKRVRLVQKIIRTTVTSGTTGSVAATSIVIPASLLSGLGAAAGMKVQVQYTSLVSNVFTST